MTTALEVINRAFSIIGIRSSEVDLTDNEIADGIETLNDMMTEQAADGLQLGFAKVIDKTDDIEVPDWSLAAIKSNLAVRLAPEYDRPLTQAVVMFADSSFTAIKNRSIVIGAASFPDTLPVGSGNRVHNDVNQPHYFVDQDFDNLHYENGQTVTDDRNRIIDINVEE